MKRIKQESLSVVQQILQFWPKNRIDLPMYNNQPHSYLAVSYSRITIGSVMENRAKSKVSATAGLHV